MINSEHKKEGQQAIIPILDDILGHSKIESTENYYISTSEKTLR